MAWSTPVTRAVGFMVTAAVWNAEHVANLLHLSTHVHDGTDGDGSASIGPLVKADLTDAAAPAAPGAGLTRLYAVAGRLRYRAGAAGADAQLVASADFSAQGDVPYFDGSSVVRLAPGTAGQFLRTAGAAANPAWATVPAVAAIAETVLGADTASIDFTSIPATYRHLMLVVFARSTDSGARSVDLAVRLNNDSTTTYLSQYIQGATTAASAAASSATYATPGHIMADNGTSLRFGGVHLWIPHYAEASNHKTIIGASGTFDSAVEGGKVRSSMSVWPPVTPAAIDQVTLFPVSGNFKAGSVVTLYGLPTG